MSKFEIQQISTSIGEYWFIIEIWYSNRDTNTKPFLFTVGGGYSEKEEAEEALKEILSL